MLAELSFDSADLGHCWHAPADIWLSSGWKVLTPHGIAWPAEHHEPTGQASQSLALIRPSLRPILPASQAVGAELPAAHQDHTVQGLHASLPSPVWYLPASHLSHTPLRTMGWTVPGLHLVCSLLPVGAKWPLSVAVHWSRRACARWAVRAALAGNASLLALTLLVLAGRALDACAHARVGRDGAGAARRLHGATGWRVVALGSRRAFRDSCEVGGVRVRALLARQRRAGALGAVRAWLAGDARLLAFTGLVRACRAPVARGHAHVGCDGAGAALVLLRAARRREVACVGFRAVCSGAKIDLVGVRARRARQRRTGARRAVKAGLAGNARLLALAGLVRTGGASVTKVSARGVRNEAGRAVSTVGWFRAPRDRVGRPRSARVARRAAILSTVWVERASRARRERLPQARRACRRAVTTFWANAALDRADILAQLASWARGAARASLVRVVGSGFARKATCLRQAGDPDWEEWLSGRSRAVIAAAVALATASEALLLAGVAEVTRRAFVRTAGEGHRGQGRWRDPQAQWAVDDGIFA
eukprot:scaffold53140_cov64-Phaeocystis_antarctica.AAC.4